MMEIEIEIGKDGALRAHVKGVKGKACLDTMELIRKAVGAMKEKKLTSEFYEFDATIVKDVRRRD